MSHIHWVTGGTGTPKDRDEVDKREVCVIVVYYKSRKRELMIRLMNESRCDERLKARVQEAICLTYTV
jgi:hypothetical protein